MRATINHIFLTRTLGWRNIIGLSLFLYKTTLESDYYCLTVL